MDISATDVRKYISQLKSMKWLGLAAHLQRVALTRGECKLIQISVIVDEDGNPLFWSEPKCTHISPAKEAMKWLNQL